MRDRPSVRLDGGSMAARLALPARTALPHLLLVGFGPPSKFPGDHGQNTSQMSKCRQSSRGWLWSVPLASGVSLHMTKAGPRWDGKPLICLGLMRCPLYSGTSGRPAACAPQPTAHPVRQELGHRTRAATKLAWDALV